jgi:hypothetical protein
MADEKKVIEEQTERIKKEQPSLDERMRRYRENRKTYDAQRSAPRREEKYRRQRGVAREYRV